MMIQEGQQVIDQEIEEKDLNTNVHMLMMNLQMATKTMKGMIIIMKGMIFQLGMTMIWIMTKEKNMFRMAYIE
jgi:hypothetical protein